MRDQKNLTIPEFAASRRRLLAGAAGALGGFTLGSLEAWAGAEEEISHTAEAIHQEVLFKASRKRVYDALTDAKQFDQVVRLSAAMQSGMVPAKNGTELGREAGGALSAFGGYITGRIVELVPNERIVQAWRSASWDPGTYSIARFVLSDQGSDSKLVFDHAGFPQGEAQHLAEGWKANYWEPLKKFLAS